MRELDTLTFHPTAEKIVKILCQQTQVNNPVFFRVMISYYMAWMAAMMRANIVTKFHGTLPINIYAVNLAPSGFCKGLSTHIIEKQLINQFQQVFEDQTLPVVADESIAKIAIKRATAENEDPDIMLKAVEKEYKDLGPWAFNFNSGTTAAVRQMRHKLLMANIGAVNLEMDEIGSNLMGNTDLIHMLLELYDTGNIKPKLIKHTKESLRAEAIKGSTPTNMMLFGEQFSLLNGDKIEEQFRGFLNTGYARRCIFGIVQDNQKDLTMTAEQMYDALTDPTSQQDRKDLSNKFAKLANANNFDKTITISKPVSIHLLEYRLHCEKMAHGMSEFDGMIKTELAHRYTKALKLAGAYAFVDGHSEITEDNLYHAIHMIEESGKAFNKIDKKEKNYVKLARFIAGVKHELTHVDLMENLAFYKGKSSDKQDLIQQAITWGYKNHVIIKRSMKDGIEFLKGETLQKTDLDKMVMAHSKDISDGYENILTPFNKLHGLANKTLHHWVNHHTANGHRSDEFIVPGFNMIVLDIDSGVPISSFNLLMKDYKYLLYTTKRHAKDFHRYRVIMPLNYHLSLNAEDFKEFMTNIFEWLPLKITPDTQTGQRSRKWLTNKGPYMYSKGEKLLDALLFIPKTSKNDDRKKVIQTYESLTNLERWFVQNAETNVNRNVQLIKYALVLVDSGYDTDTIRKHVLEMNDKLPDSLKEKEIDDTVMVTVGKRLIAKQAA